MGAAHDSPAAELSVAFTSQPGFIEATMTGNASLASALRAWEEICDAALDSHADAIVVDRLRIGGSLSITDSFVLGKAIAEYLRQRAKSPSIAVVGQPGVISGFAAEAAQNDGVRIRVFTDRSEALEWLKDVAR